MFKINEFEINNLEDLKKVIEENPSIINEFKYKRVIDKDIKRNLAKMMLFGELKNGGWATITVDGDQLMIVAKGKEPKTVPLLTVEATENVV